VLGNERSARDAGDLQLHTRTNFPALNPPSGFGIEARNPRGARVRVAHLSMSSDPWRGASVGVGEDDLEALPIWTLSASSSRRFPAPKVGRGGDRHEPSAVL